MEETIMWVVSNYGMEILTLLGGPVGIAAAIWAFWSMVRGRNQKCEAEVAKAEETRDWTKEVEGLSIPHPDLPNAVNAARMAVFAHAAYPSMDGLRMALKERLAKLGVAFYEWNNLSADGIITYHPASKIMYIGIAGTDSLDDAKLDADTFSSRIENQFRASGVDATDDAKGIRSTQGFLTYTVLCSKAIKRCLLENEIRLDEVEKILIAGHSLAGCASTLLTYVEGFQNAEVFTYGSAKAYRAFSKQAPRKHVRVRDMFDPVAYMPIQCRHQKDAQPVIVRGPGSVKEAISVFYKPLVVLVSLLFWIVGLCGNIGTLFFGKKTVSVADSHSMAGYAQNLRPLQ